MLLDTIKKQPLILYFTRLNYILDTIFLVDIFSENYEANIIDPKKSGQIMANFR